MRLKKKITASLALLLLFSFETNSVFASKTSDITLIYSGALMTNPENEILINNTIVVQGRLIANILDGFKTPQELGMEGAKVIDLKTKFVMPGLMDTHVHLTTALFDENQVDTNMLSPFALSQMAAANAKRVVEAGFTTVMDLGTGHRNHEIAIYQVRDAIKVGKLKGPDIMAVGSPISKPGFSRASSYKDKIGKIIDPEGVCNDTKTCIARVKEQVERGADIINVYHTGSMLTPNSVAQTFSNEELRSIADAAHQLGRVVIADGGNTPDDARGTNNAIRAGFTVIDTVSLPDAETFKLLKGVNGYFAPHVFAQIDGVGDTMETLEEGSMGWAPRPLLELLFKFKQLKPSALIAYESGANLLISSDSGVIAHGKNAQELVEYIALGISPLDTLKAATTNVAKAFNIYERTGSISVGKEADIIAVGENPLKTMTTVLNPAFVMSDGKVMVER